MEKAKTKAKKPALKKRAVKKEKKEIEVLAETSVEASVEQKEILAIEQAPDAVDNIEEKKEALKPGSYLESTGKRKTSVARVRLYTQGEKEIIVNGKTFDKYFPTDELQQIILSPLKKMKCADIFRISVIVRGGGIHSQSEAIRHGITRGLVKFNPDFRKRLRKAGYITRDPRVRERKKFGLKRARRAPQWAKR